MKPLASLQTTLRTALNTVNVRAAKAAAIVPAAVTAAPALSASVGGSATYYGTAATQNPWASCATAPSAQEQAGWSDSTRALYQRTVDASRSRSALVQAGLLPRG